MNKIRHAGVIEEIDGSHIVVRIVQTTACAACQVASRCHASESKEKLIDIYDAPYADNRQKGEEVVVCADTSLGMKAVGLAFGIPFLILVFVLIVMLHITNNEPLSALVAMVALLPYYVVLFMMRHKVGRKFAFKIETN